MTKKFIFVALAVLMALSTILISCSKTPTAQPTTTTTATVTTTASTAPEQMKTVVIATKEPGSTSYSANIPIAQVVTKYAPFKMYAEPSGDLEQVVTYMEKGQIQLVSSSAPEVMATYMGVLWSQQKTPWLRMALSHYEAPYMWVAANNGPNTFAELKGKRFAGYATTSPTFGFFGDALLKKYGVTDVQKISASSTSNLTTMLIEGKADVAATSLAPRMADIEKSPGGMKIIPTTQEDVDFINKEAGAGVAFYTTIAKGYLGLKAFEKEMNYLAIAAVWATSKDVPDDIIYQVVKQTYEHYDEFKGAYTKCAEFKLENALRAFPAPYHNGAIKYFKEKGIWGAAQEKMQADLLKATGQTS